METKEIYYYYYAPREMEQGENLNEQKGLFQAHRCYQREYGRETAFSFHPSTLCVYNTHVYNYMYKKSTVTSEKKKYIGLKQHCEIHQ